MDQVPLNIMTWNILAEMCCDDTDEGFPFVPKEALSNTERVLKIREHILNSDADIIALQEVDQPQRYLEDLRNQGYLVVYQKRGRSPLGILTAFKTARISVLREIKECLYDDRWCCGAELSFQNKTLLFLTTHLSAKAKGKSNRLLQALKLCTSLRYCDNVIIAGDFNDTPESEVVFEMLKHDFLMGTVSKTHQQFTTYKIRKNGDGTEDLQQKIEDYFFFRTKDFECTSIQPAQVNIPQCGLPSVEFPSDHLSLHADFKLRN
jgi:mRNA deadenylase 3'-5' endonuclease subunit Ccr4